MSNLQGEIQDIINKYVNQLFDSLVQNNGVDRSVLESTWGSIVGSKIESRKMVNLAPIDTAGGGCGGCDDNSVVPTTVQHVPQQSTGSPPNPEIMNANVSELKAMCKARKLSVGGKKQDLIDRLLPGGAGAGGSTSTSTPDKVAPPAPKKKKRSPNRMPQIPISSIQIKKNSHGNYEHPETKMIFEKDTKQVIGKQQDDGSISTLTDEDIQQCDQFKFNYHIPEKIVSNADSKLSSKPAAGEDEIVETLEDIIGSDEEEFEEFYEDAEDDAE